MITSKNFTWRLRSNDLRVQALKFPISKGVTFEKDLTLNGACYGELSGGWSLIFEVLGINNFDGSIVLKEFQLPSDNPEGGINFYSVTTLTNLRCVTGFRVDILSSHERSPAPSNSTLGPLFLICSIKTFI
jgi:Protein of unknown function (DUF3712)